MSEIIPDASTIFSRVLRAKLHTGGWRSDRDDASIESNYARLLGQHWIPAAASFVRKFGGISVYGRLWIWSEPIWDGDLITIERRIEEVIRSKAVPIATSSYLGDGCVIWIDEHGRFYATASEGMIFVGDGVAAALEVLLLGSALPERPPELEDQLATAYEWNSKSEMRVGDNP